MAKVMHSSRLLPAIFLSVLAASPSGANALEKTLTGVPRITDADTFWIGDEEIRLLGVDAPERHQKCRCTSREWYACGKVATSALKTHIAGQAITCLGHYYDRHARLVSVCTLEGEDVNGWLAREGHAVASQIYSTDYVRDEEKARKAKRGIWGGEFVIPWKWRKGERLPGEEDAEI